MIFLLQETISNLFSVVTCLLGPESTRPAMFMALKSKSLLSQRMSPWPMGTDHYFLRLKVSIESHVPCLRHVVFSRTSPSTLDLSKSWIWLVCLPRAIVTIFVYFSFLCLIYLVPHESFSQSLCMREDTKISSFHLEEIKKKFRKEMNDHYSHLVKSNSISKSKKNKYLKRYRNPSIKTYSDPLNRLQKIVYIEYDKNWWGSLYFALFRGKEILKWIKIDTYGAITTCVRWDKKRFFYIDSTHRGTKTKNVCFFQKGSVHCKKSLRSNSLRIGFSFLIKYPF